MEYTLTDGTTILIDAEDASRVAQHRWGMWRRGQSHETIAAKYYLRINVIRRTSKGKRANIILSRFIVNARTGSQVCFKNRDKLDFRKENLVETFPLTAEDVNYVRWLGDNGWFGWLNKRGDGHVNIKAVAKELGRSENTVRCIAYRIRDFNIPEYAGYYD